MINTNWIKCSDRLPEKAGQYKAKTEKGSEFPCFYTTTLSGKMVWVLPDGINIIEWQPLPEAPNVNE